MKILHKDPSRPLPPAERVGSNRAQGERFAKLIEREKNGDNGGGVRAGLNGAQDAKLNPALDVRKSLLIAGPNAVSSQSVALADEVQSSSSGTAAPPELETLAEELGARLELVNQAGTARDLNLTFESQAFAGLRVHLQQAAGEVGIRFMTNSPSISGLLRQHAGTLRETLAQKGVKVRAVTVAGFSARRFPEEHDHA